MQCWSFAGRVELSTSEVVMLRPQTTSRYPRHWHSLVLVPTGFSLQVLQCYSILFHSMILVSYRCYPSVQPITANEVTVTLSSGEWTFSPFFLPNGKRIFVVKIYTDYRRYFILKIPVFTFLVLWFLPIFPFFKRS